MQTNPKAEIEACRKMLAKIEEYKTKRWAIGLGYPKGEPDAIFAFFEARGLRCKAYLTGDFTVGTSAAYDENLATLGDYLKRFATHEITLCLGTIARLRDHQAKGWAVGLEHAGGQPDSFSSFFVRRGLPIRHYLPGEIPVGDASAYDANIATLEAHLQSLAP